MATTIAKAVVGSKMKDMTKGFEGMISCVATILEPSN